MAEDEKATERRNGSEDRGLGCADGHVRHRVASLQGAAQDLRSRAVRGILRGMTTRTVAGVKVPAFLYGTAWKEERTEELARLALVTGFRGIDTANQRRHYFEAAVGNAVARAENEHLIARDQLFLQTKFTYRDGQDHRLPYDPMADSATQVRQSFESSLEHLRTTYLDAYLLHGPSSHDQITRTDWAVWRAMEALYRDEKVRLLGVSNVSLSQLMMLAREASIPPIFVQNRCYARTGWDREVRVFCDQVGIVYQAFSLLTANPRALASPVVARIAARVRRPPTAVIFRFALQVGMIPLTGTSSEAHMKDDLGSFEFELTDADVRAIERVERAS